MLGPFHQNQHCLRDPPHPSQNGFFHLIDKITDFLHNKPFFLIAPRNLHYYWASAQPCAVNNNFFSLCEGPKWGFFHLIDKIADFLHNKLFFSDSPEEFALLLGQCASLRSLAQPCTVNKPFLASGKAQNGVFSTLSNKSQTFYTINFFF